MRNWHYRLKCRRIKIIQVEEIWNKKLLHLFVGSKIKVVFNFA